MNEHEFFTLDFWTLDFFEHESNELNEYFIAHGSHGSHGFLQRDFEHASHELNE